MRKTLLLACLAISTVSFLGCGDAGTSNLSARRGAPAPGSQDPHDDSTDGANDPDPGNPNADTTPDAPTDPGTSSAQFALQISTNTPTVDLGGKVDIDVTVQPTGGFTGDVDITVTGLPAGVTAAPLKVKAGATGKLSLSAAVTSIPSAPGASSALVITGTSGTTKATANANFKVAPKMVLTIPMNIDALRQANAGTVYINEWGNAFGAAQQALSTQTGNGIVVTVFNADSKQHIVHGANGFAHGSTTTGNEIQPNSFEMVNGAPRTRTLNPGVNCNGYMHEGANGPSVSFRISVQEAN